MESLNKPIGYTADKPHTHSNSTGEIVEESVIFVDGKATKQLKSYPTDKTYKVIGDSKTTLSEL